MWWGHSPPLDLQEEILQESFNSDSENPIEILIIGGSDARHIIKTLGLAYKHPKRSILFHVIEPTLEQIARSVLLLNICFESDLGLQEATRYHLEILGNTLLRPATAKYLIKRCNKLIDLPSRTVECSWLDFEKLKHKERDSLESIFKFWERAAREGVPITTYWDNKIRKSLKTRYDCRDGVFDWDYHMVLKSRADFNLTLHEYRFWRNNGVAFIWIEGEPIRSNPTLISNIVPQGNGFIHFGYMGDITNGPFFTWALHENSVKKKIRGTDVAEKETMRAIYELRNKEPMCDEIAAAHRDPSILNGTIVAEMPDVEIEQENWTEDKLRKTKENIRWIGIENAKIIFHSVSALESYKQKAEYLNKFDVIWMAHNVTKHLPKIVPLLKRNRTLLIESRKFLTELRNEDLEKFTKEIRELAKNNELREMYEFDSKKHVFARFSRC